MIENLRVSFEAIVPLFVLMAVGAALRKKGMLDEALLPRLNTLVFRLFLPLMLFDNIYSTASSLEQAVDPALLAFAAAGVLAVYALSLALVLAIEKRPAQRGAMIQALFRSNFLILGLPISRSLFGEERASVTAMAVACVIPLFNVLAVVTLETFRRGGHVDAKKILRGIAVNPLIWASVLGLAALGAGVRLPAVIQTPVEELGTIATPLALLCLGASLRLDRVRGNRRNLAICVVGRLVVVPALTLPVAALLGFRGVAMGTLMAVFASPTAVTSWVMAQQMDSDGELAGQAVVFTSVFSCLTIFLWTFGLKQVGWM